jgi:hypothetical protein
MSVPVLNKWFNVRDVMFRTATPHVHDDLPGGIVLSSPLLKPPLYASCSAQKEWGHSAQPPALLNVHPHVYQELAMCCQPYYFSTHNAGLTQYECGRMKPLL